MSPPHPGQAPAGFVFVMTESNPSPTFERIPNLQRPIVVESYCRVCGLFVGADADSYLLTRAELDHSCEWLLTVF